MRQKSFFVETFQTELLISTFPFFALEEIYSKVQLLESNFSIEIFKWYERDFLLMLLLKITSQVWYIKHTKWQTLTIYLILLFILFLYFLFTQLIFTICLFLFTDETDVIGAFSQSDSDDHLSVQSLKSGGSIDSGVVLKSKSTPRLTMSSTGKTIVA